MDKCEQLVPLGFPDRWQAFNMACFFWTSVREKPERTNEERHDTREGQRMS